MSEFQNIDNEQLDSFLTGFKIIDTKLDTPHLKVFIGNHKESNQDVEIIHTTDPILAKKYKHIVELNPHPARLQSIVSANCTGKQASIALKQYNNFISLENADYPLLSQAEIIAEDLADALAEFHAANVYLGEMCPHDILIDPETKEFACIQFPRYYYLHTFDSKLFDDINKDFLADWEVRLPAFIKWLELSGAVATGKSSKITLNTQIYMALSPWLTARFEEVGTEAGDVWALGSLLLWAASWDIIGRFSEGARVLLSRLISYRFLSSIVRAELGWHLLAQTTLSHKILGMHNSYYLAGVLGGGEILENLLDKIIDTPNKREVKTIQAFQRAFKKVKFINLEVRILDDKQSPVGGINVILKQPNSSLHIRKIDSDEHGKVFFENLMEGEYVITLDLKDTIFTRLREREIELINEYESYTIKITKRSKKGFLRRLFGQ